MTRLQTGQRSCARMLGRLLLSILAVLIPISVGHAAYNNVIRSGTPIDLGQYCTAVLGSTADPRCLSQLQGDQGTFKKECQSVVGMFYQPGNGLYDPEDRCLVNSNNTTNHTLTVSASPTSGGTVSGGGTYYDGNSVTVTAVPKIGFLFSSWTENGTVVSWDANYTFTLVTNRTLVAYFGVGTTNYSISVSAAPAGSGVVGGGGSYQAGGSTTVTATAATCHIFSSWTENGTVVSWAPTYTFSPVKDRNLVAYFGSLVKTSHDFDADIKSDILWRNNSGPLSTWLMNGGSVKQSIGIGSVQSVWQIAGVGDFDGDAKADILWRNTSTGDVALWLLNGGVVKQALTVATVPTTWTIAAVGDFNFDNRTDILWRNSDGSLVVWLLDGNTVKNSQGIGSVTADWKVAGIGDFDGDGKSDILWRQDTGAVALWTMNGAAVIASFSIAAVPTNWTIAGVGDFDGDCKSDILWRQDTGAVALWLMNGAALKSNLGVATVSTDWQIVGVGDFDGDNKADILWRQTGGAVAMWLMNISAAKSSVGIGSVTTDWQITK